MPADWLSPLIAFGAIPALALLAVLVVELVLGRLARMAPTPLLRPLVQAGHWPQRLTVMLLAAGLALPGAGLAGAATAALDRVLSVAVAGALGWTITRKVAAAFDARLAALAPEAGDADLSLRQQRTRLTVFRRVSVGLSVVLTAGVVLTAIPAVQAVGLSLFASAGVAGIVVGIAARPAVSNLIAGLQLALTQPIRIGDAVQIEGAWGRVQEITSSYVTVVTWDQRSLVVPLSWLLERPITNWTRDSAQLLDTVFLYLDHTAPVDAIRCELTRLLEGEASWDGRTATVQVTAVKEGCIELRILLSAADATRMWALRCLVRERLLAWLVREHPQALPRVRQASVIDGSA